MQYGLEKMCAQEQFLCERAVCANKFINLILPLLEKEIHYRTGGWSVPCRLKIMKIFALYEIKQILEQIDALKILVSELIISHSSCDMHFWISSFLLYSNVH